MGFSFVVNGFECCIWRVSNTCKGTMRTRHRTEATTEPVPSWTYSRYNKMASFNGMAQT